MRRMSWPILVLVALGATSSLAADRPIAATKLVLKRTTSGREKLAFVSKDPTFLFPTLGSPNDPSIGGSNGLLVELFAPASPTGVPLPAPGGSGVPGWTAYASVPARLSFRNGGAPDAFSSFRSITLRQGNTIKITGKLAGLPLTEPSGSVAVRITTGALRNCAIFTGAAVVKDVAGSFAAHNAPAPAITDCSNASLGGVTTTTTTSTTLAGVCGDGVINQPSEVCDGAALGACAGSPAGICGFPGYPTACQCCSIGSTPDFGVSIPCCDPGAQVVYSPSTATCVSTDCSGPFTCLLGTCQNGTCCAATGAVCGAVGGGGSSASVACCDPTAVCGFPHNSFPTASCCKVPGGTCTTTSDCCGGTCDAGTCSCGLTGDFCLSNAQCCSGTCAGLSCS
jgi:hypothetical protein